MLYLVKQVNGEARVFLSAEEANREALGTSAGAYLAVNATVTSVEAKKAPKQKAKTAATVSDEVAELRKEIADLKAAKAKKE